MLTSHICAIVSSNTPPASSAPSPTRFTFQAREGHRTSTDGFFKIAEAIWGNTGLDVTLTPVESSLQQKFKIWSRYQDSSAKIFFSPSREKKQLSTKDKKLIKCALFEDSMLHCISTCTPHVPHMHSRCLSHVTHMSLTCTPVTHSVVTILCTVTEGPRDLCVMVLPTTVAIIPSTVTGDTRERTASLDRGFT